MLTLLQRNVYSIPKAGFVNCFNIQRRWFDWDPNLTRKSGKPAITGTKAAYVASEIPVVLLRDVAGLGSKGAIVNVKRGYARNVLVPGGSAVFGTLWENIDAYADPEVTRKQGIANEAILQNQESSSVPFSWLNDVRIEFQREADERGMVPLLLPEFLDAMSDREGIDLFPSQITNFPDSGFTTSGRFSVGITLQLTVGIFQYTVKVDLKDKAEVAAAERREAELLEAMKMKRPTFQLGSLDNAEADEDSDDEKSSP